MLQHPCTLAHRPEIVKYNSLYRTINTKLHEPLSTLLQKMTPKGQNLARSRRLPRVKRNLRVLDRRLGQNRPVLATRGAESSQNTVLNRSLAVLGGLDGAPKGPDCVNCS